MSRMCAVSPPNDDRKSEQSNQDQRAKSTMLACSLYLATAAARGRLAHPEVGERVRLEGERPAWTSTVGVIASQPLFFQWKTLSLVMSPE